MKASSTSGASTVQAYAVRLKAPAVGTNTVDSFATSDFRGMKYYLSATDPSGSVSNMEAMVVHDGTDAYITTFNEHFSNTSLYTLSAAISGSNVVVTGTPLVPDTTLKFYRISISDGLSGCLL